VWDEVGRVRANGARKGAFKAMKRLVFGILLLTVVSCAKKPMRLDPSKQTDQQIYQMGVGDLKDKNYAKAREAFRTVFESFPKSDLRIDAKIGIGDSYFREGGTANFLLAIQEYQDFVSLFPFSPKAEYAQLQTGLCYSKMVEKPDRDQTNTRKALDEFKKVVDNYPNGAYFDKATEELKATYSRLADHEYMIAQFYARTGKHAAAIDRLKGLLKSFPESIYKPEYYYDLAGQLKELGEDAESCSYYGMLIEKWPNSGYAVKAEKSRPEVCRQQ
jgi:outer membrane assembly lipoprotein YfiO